MLKKHRIHVVCEVYVAFPLASVKLATLVHCHCQQPRFHMLYVVKLLMAGVQFQKCILVTVFSVVVAVAMNEARPQHCVRIQPQNALKAPARI
jgi:hypothetical protein